MVLLLKKMILRRATATRPSASTTMYARARIALLLAVTLGLIGWGSAAFAAQRPGVRFRAYLVSRFGVRNPRWWTCPGQERFNGLALCEAQFRQGSRWRFVSAAVRNNGNIAYAFTNAWLRRWRDCRVRDRRYVPGTLRANTNTTSCGGYELMASDIQYDVQFRRRFPRFAHEHGTNTAGFGARALYRCHRVNRTARCTNSLGDSFRYTVPRRFI